MGENYQRKLKHKEKAKTRLLQKEQKRKQKYGLQEKNK